MSSASFNFFSLIFCCCWYMYTWFHWKNKKKVFAIMIFHTTLLPLCYGTIHIGTFWLLHNPLDGLLCYPYYGSELLRHAINTVIRCTKSLLFTLYTIQNCKSYCKSTQPQRSLPFVISIITLLSHTDSLTHSLTRALRMGHSTFHSWSNFFHFVTHVHSYGFIYKCACAFIWKAVMSKLP